ncbi:MAG: DUF5009 domain-containing protein [Asticcacaulis sp.]|nr:DUF5009 domain-containing protein [Asticcacaulis sp.]
MYEPPIGNNPVPAITRVASIDILRALTMVLMIFVNDLWTLKGVPAWLEHVESGVDGMGLADTVFPAFLFIVGLSLPFAVDARQSKGDSDRQLILHVVLRAFALIVMGLFLVNGETLNEAAMGLDGGFWLGPWNALSCVAFVLVWNSWPRSWPAWAAWLPRITGAAILVGLAVVYRGSENGQVQMFAPHWWGILGIIGWAYLLAGVIAVAAHGRLSLLIAAWLALCGLSILNAAHLVPSWLDILPAPLRDGTHAGLVMGGAVIGRLFQLWQPKDRNLRMTLLFLAIAAGLAALYAVTRPYWGLSKIAATPAWLFACSGLTLVAFIVVYWLADVWGGAKWFAPIRPAGTETLLCYLMPYFLYVMLWPLNANMPEAMVTGGPGLVKSFLFALLCVFIVGGLSRLGVRLKL